MSAQIRYAYLKDHTWLFRRHWPKDVALVLGQSVLKQSLKTGDAVTARVRAAETNARFETQVAEVRAGAQKALSGSESSVVRPAWAENPTVALDHLRATLEHSGAVSAVPGFQRLTAPQKTPVRDQSRAYPRMTEELKEIGLDVGHRRVGRLMRQNGISVVRTRKHKVTTIARQAIAKQSAERGTAITSSTLRRTCWIATSTPTSPIKNGPAISAMSGHARGGFISR